MFLQSINKIVTPNNQKLKYFFYFSWIFLYFYTSKSKTLKFTLAYWPLREEINILAMRQMNEGILMKHKWREWGENKDY
jgi:hypothetical protein